MVKRAYRINTAVTQRESPSSKLTRALPPHPPSLHFPFPKTRYQPGNVNGTPASLLSWGIWLLNDRLLDKVMTPSPTQKGDLSIGGVRRKRGEEEEGGVEEGNGGGIETQ